MTEPTGEQVEMLRLCRELSDAASTEAALIERASRLAGFSHPCFAQVRRVERLHGPLGGLVVVSAAVPGVRLSEVLRQAGRTRTPADFGAALSMLRQVAGAIADLHRCSREIAHGALGPERIVVSPDGRPIIVEQVLAPALEQLQMGRAPLWAKFRVPVPPVAGTARFDQLTDVVQLGMLALALSLGRPIRQDEYPNRLQELLTQVSAQGPAGGGLGVPAALRTWILKTFQFEPRSSFRTAAEAAAALDALNVEELECGASFPSIASQASGSEREETVRLVRHEAHAPGPVPPSVAADGSRPLEGGGRPSVRQVRVVRRSRVTRATVRRLPQFTRVAGLSMLLAAVYGVTYLGARGYLGLPSLLGGRGTLVVESRPAGIDLYVDGFPRGQTPVTLDLSAGEHTLVLRTGRGVTLVPSTVVAGTRRIEFVEIRQRRLGPRPQPVSASPGRRALPARSGGSN